MYVHHIYDLYYIHTGKNMYDIIHIFSCKKTTDSITHAGTHAGICRGLEYSLFS